MRTKVAYRQASKENWKRYCIAHPDTVVSYLDYQNIIYTFNYGFRDYLLETGLKGRYPWGMGDFCVCKFKRKDTKTLSDGRVIENFPIDWKKTKEHGEYIYHLNRHTEGYEFKWKWFPKSAWYKNADIFVFKTSRLTSRILKHYLFKPNQHHKYFNWK